MSPLDILIIILLFIVVIKLIILLLSWIELLKTPAERKYTSFDKELGWVNLPNVYIKDLYGEGVYLKTNSQRFRNNEDFSVDIPKGKIRIICSGDSFTMGHGVDNDHCWCQILSSLDPRVETVNMGQSAYGIDQAYLWYMREGVKLEHDIHLFSFISDDFFRMERNDYDGYGKPKLKLKDGELVVDKVLNSKPNYPIFCLKRLILLIRCGWSFRLLRGIIRGIFYRKSNSRQFYNNPQTHDIVLKIVDNLQKINTQKSSVIVFIYMPTMWDFDPTPELEDFKKILSLDLSKIGVLYVDLTEDFKKLLPFERKSMFLREPAIATLVHYSVKGNMYMADLIYKKLKFFQQTSEILARDFPG